ncbi:MAG: VOC family protein [Kosmotogaceae bacterium]
MKWQGLISFYGTDDLEKTAEFYEGMLNLKMIKDQGKCRIFSVPGGGALGFCIHMNITVVNKSPIITLLTDDVDGVYKQLIKKGYRVPQEPVLNEEFKIYHFFTRDPSGYYIEIQKFLD